jgi:hypothetical protein
VTNGYIRSNRENVRRERLSTSFQMIRRLTLSFKWDSCRDEALAVAGERITGKMGHGIEISYGLYTCVPSVMVVSQYVISRERKIHTKSVALARERIILTELQPIVGEVSANFRLWCRATDLHGRLLDSLDRRRYYFFRVAPKLYSRALFPMKPSNATKFQRSTLTFYFHSLHVSAPTRHLQVRYTTDAHKDYSYHNGSFDPWASIHAIKRSI